jgi:hypothetical protein
MTHVNYSFAHGKWWCDTKSAYPGAHATCSYRHDHAAVDTSPRGVQERLAPLRGLAGNLSSAGLIAFIERGNRTAGFIDSLDRGAWIAPGMV